MSLIRLVYVSRSKSELSSSDMKRILTSSIEKNKKLNITGVLFYDSVFFLQCLEGPKEAVKELYSQIEVDDRHNSVTQLEEVHISERDFPLWSMGYIPTDSVAKDLIMKYGAFNPLTMSGKDAFNFLRELSKNVSNIISY